MRPRRGVLRVTPLRGWIRYTSEPWQFGQTTPFGQRRFLQELPGVGLGAEPVGKGRNGVSHDPIVARGYDSYISVIPGQRGSRGA